MDRRLAAFVGVGLAIATSAGFYGFTFYCGAMEVEANEPGAPENEPHCVSAPYPPALIYAVLSIVALYAVARRLAWPLIGLGTLMTAGGVLFIFSFGFVGIGVGFLIVLSGLTLVGSGPRDKSIISEAR